MQHKNYNKYISFLLAVIVVTLGCQLSNGSREKPILPKIVGEFPFQYLWSQSFPKKILTLSTGEENKLFVRTNRKIYGVDTYTGAQVWDFIVSSDVDGSKPMNFDDLLFVGNTSSIGAFNLTKQKWQWNNEIDSYYDATILAYSSEYVIVNIVGKSVSVYDAQTGKFQWSVWTGRGRSSATINDNKAYIEIDEYLQIHDLESGKLLDEVYLNISNPNIFSENNLFYKKFSNESLDKSTIVAYDTSRDIVSWEKDINQVVEQMVVSEKYLILSTSTELFVLDIYTGDVLWSTGVYGAYSKPVLVKDYLFARTAFNNRVYAFSIQDGTELGYLDLGNNNILFAEKDEGVEGWKDSNDTGFLYISIDSWIVAYSE